MSEDSPNAGAPDRCKIDREFDYDSYEWGCSHTLTMTRASEVALILALMAEGRSYKATGRSTIQNGAQEMQTR